MFEAQDSALKGEAGPGLLSLSCRFSSCLLKVIGTVGVWNEGCGLLREKHNVPPSLASQPP